MTNPLSPAAQAVMDACTDAPIQINWATKLAAAAALRALAVRINGADAIRQDILDIADELEGGGA